MAVGQGQVQATALGVEGRQRADGLDAPFVADLVQRQVVQVATQGAAKRVAGAAGLAGAHDVRGLLLQKPVQGGHAHAQLHGQIGRTDAGVAAQHAG